MERVQVNVGGKRFSTLRTTLEANGPNYFTAKLSGGWRPEPGDEWFVDRSPQLFEHVLNFQRGYVLHLGQPEHAMLLQDAKFYGIAPLIAFCKAQLGEAPRELVDQLDALLERCKEEARHAQRTLYPSVLEKVEEARESGDKETVQAALHHLKAWQAVPQGRRWWLMGATGLGYVDRRWWPDQGLGALEQELRRLLLEDPETEEHLFRAALHSETAPAASPLWQLLFFVLVRLVSAWLTRSLQPHAQPTAAPAAPPAQLNLETMFGQHAQDHVQAEAEHAQQPPQ